MQEGEKEPSFLEMIRAPFLFAIIVPLFSGTLVSVAITGKFNLFGFILVLVIGISLHITTNVYNDIYDTKQGADNRNSMKSEFSGGSGIIVERPGVLPKMFSIARGGIIVGIIGSILLMFFIERRLWINLWSIITISVFLSKYYTAEPIKFAYRGLGEIIVWIGFGPLAVLLAGIGQNIFYHPVLISITPITGFATLFIVWMGEMVDLPTDRDGGKLGLVARMGFKKSRYGLVGVHSLAAINVVFVMILSLNPGWPLLIAVIPHIVLILILWNKLKGIESYGDQIRSISGLNFKIYAVFSLLLMAGYAADVIIKYFF